MYTIKKTDHKITQMNDPVWEKAEVASININNWKQFEYLPNTYGRLMYDEEAIYIKMWTDENPLLARYTKQNDPVHKDSCMELFLSPKAGDKRYLNIEINPFGTMSFAIRTSRFDPVYPDKDKNFFAIQTLVEDGCWTLQFMIPFAYIDQVFGGHTKEMQGNLYKCGEDMQREHYGSMYPMHPTEIDFHRSEFFGEFILE
ncbi:MAG: carbohydrate-binding family 9-like protein [Clostridia bacterium]|nr:carbohydrate-binding family 9-like protein [Clostridia bacterium]